MDPIADELIMKFGDFDLLHGGGGEGDSRTDASSTNYGVELEPSDAAVDFRDRVSQILRGHAETTRPGSAAAEGAGVGVGGTMVPTTMGKAGMAGIPGEVSIATNKAGKPRRVLGGTLDKDLRAYFMQEDHTRHLSSLGFFERDDFMDFD